MTKKYYEAIAAILKNNALVSRTIALQLADYFETDNKLFDRARFLAACGIVD